MVFDERGRHVMQAKMQKVKTEVIRDSTDVVGRLDETVVTWEPVGRMFE
jgi:hypothetical protein